MIRYPYLAGLAAFALVNLACATAPAFFHLWRFTEFFSNADGTVQFIELQSGGPSETLANGAEFRSLSTGKLVTLSGNLSGSTQNKRLLLATPAFDLLPGAVAPDYQIPTNFFDPAGDTISLVHHQPIDSRTFSSVPTDGLTSLNFPSGETATNSPTNFVGDSGSLGAGILSGDYSDNGVVDAADYIVFRENLNTLNFIPNDLTPNWVMDDDYDVWRAHFGTSGNDAGLGATLLAAVPEPATWGLPLAGLLLMRGSRSARTTRYRSARGGRCLPALS